MDAWPAACGALPPDHDVCTPVCAWIVMLALMFMADMPDLLRLLAPGGLMLVLVQKGRVWGARMAWPTAGVLAVAGLALLTGWWQRPLLHLRALCG